MEHPPRMFTWISRYYYSYMVEEEACLRAHFGYIRHQFLLLDEPRIPPITIEAHTMCHIPVERTSRCGINHVITYHTYLGFEQPNTSLQFVRHFLGHDASGRATRSHFYHNTAVEVYEDVGDFIDDEDLMPSDISFYQGVYGEEIFRGEMVSSDKEWDSSGDESDPFKDMTLP